MEFKENYFVILVWPKTDKNGIIYDYPYVNNVSRISVTVLGGSLGKASVSSAEGRGLTAGSYQ